MVRSKGDPGWDPVGGRHVKPVATSQAVTARMQATRRRDTPAELDLRRQLHRRGYRYRVDVSIPAVTRARPDLVFPTERVAVFVDGCFWHSCPDHGTSPRANSEWWDRKLRSNVERDRRHNDELGSAGWIVIRIWEHDDPVTAAEAIIKNVIGRRAASD